MSTGASGVEFGEDAAIANPRRCAACRHLRRRCAHDCVLAPYFSASQPDRYACVHRVFGAGNVTRFLESLPVQERAQAADTVATEARWRVQEPVYGCAGIISGLQEDIRAVQCELARTRAQLPIAVHGQQAVPRSPPRAGARRVDMQVQGRDVQETTLVDTDRLPTSVVFKIRSTARIDCSLSVPATS